MKWISTLSLTIFAIFSQAAFSIPKATPVSWRLSFEELPLADGTPMGVLGIHYDAAPIDRWRELYIGVGGYAGMTGDEGGYFTTGITLGWRHAIVENWAIDIGSHFGGGGGSDRTFPGGGMFTRQHAALEWKFRQQSLRLGIAYTDFPNTTSAEAADLHGFAGWRLDEWAWLGTSNDTGQAIPSTLFRQLRIAPAVIYQIPHKHPIMRDGSYKNGSTNEAFSLVGVQISRSLNEHWFTTLEAYGASGGGADGYAGIYWGLGHQYPLFDNGQLFWISKLTAGLAGDGRIDTGGGAMIRPMLGFKWQPHEHWAFNILGGETIALDGRFRAHSLEFGLAWQGDIPVPAANVSGIAGTSHQTPWIVALGHKTYRPDSASRNNRGLPYDRNLQLVGLEISRYFGDYIVLLGNTHWAFEGNIGSYAEGMWGAQLTSGKLLSDRFSVFGFYGVGVSGGGDMEVDKGFLHEASGGIKLKLNSSLSIETSLGRTQSIGGSFKANTLRMQLLWQQELAYR